MNDEVPISRYEYHLFALELRGYADQLRAELEKDRKQGSKSLPDRISATLRKTSEIEVFLALAPR